MQHFLLRVSTILSFVSIFSLSAMAQDTSRTTSVDPDLIDLANSRIPKEYTITNIRVTGVNFLDTSIVTSISGLQVGDRVQIPGGDAFSKAITNLWRQRLFSNVQIFITSVTDDKIGLEINLTERPRLGNFKFVGIKKTEADELQG
jgi:outer membrane protein insertion porin family